MNDVKFDIFTFQLSTLSNVQFDLFGKPMAYEDIVKNKNIYFDEVLNSELVFYSNRALLNYKIEYSDNEFVLFRLANKRTVAIEKDFHKEVFNSEPSCLIAFYNDPTIQIIAIESDRSSFGNSFQVVKIIERAIEKKLIKYYLSFNVQPKYEPVVLWNLLEKYEKRIEKLQFQFSKPNLPRVNQSLSEELKEASVLLNSGTTKLEFTAPDQQVLENLNKDNEELSNLVNASSEGAGPTKLKLKGIRRWESTENNVKSIEIDSLEVESDSNTILTFVEHLKAILKSE